MRRSTTRSMMTPRSWSAPGASRGTPPIVCMMWTSGSGGPRGPTVLPLGSSSATGCSDFLTVEFRVEAKVSLTRRTYKKASAIIGEFGGMLKIFTGILFFFYSLYSQGKMKAYLVEKVFMKSEDTQNEENEEDKKFKAEESLDGAMKEAKRKELVDEAKKYLEVQRDVVKLSKKLILVEIIGKLILEKKNNCFEKKSPEETILHLQAIKMQEEAAKKEREQGAEGIQENEPQSLPQNHLALDSSLSISKSLKSANSSMISGWESQQAQKRPEDKKSRFFHKSKKEEKYEENPLDFSPDSSYAGGEPSNGGVSTPSELQNQEEEDSRFGESKFEKAYRALLSKTPSNTVGSVINSYIIEQLRETFGSIKLHRRRNNINSSPGSVLRSFLGQQNHQRHLHHHSRARGSIGSKSNQKSHFSRSRNQEVLKFNKVDSRMMNF